ncbi:hypothetical protein [Streptomyces sp. NPDC085665]|uniref:hypothetical protein n=1 Tax=Streptomyces sp. NPDC085665 TaxID=3365735 RepID=UPI0037CD9BE1
MIRRLVALLVALVAVFAVSVSAPQPAAAADPIGKGIGAACQVAGGVVGSAILGPIGGIAGGFGSGSLCDNVGKAASKEVKAQWKKVQDSILGDIIVATGDLASWILKKVLTVALLGPSVDLEATGLWSGKATLAGMLVWLGLLIAAAGVMWQMAKMALTGQAKHLGRAMLGWVENLVLSTVGVGLFVTLLEIGDAISTGLVDATFKDDGKVWERIIEVMIPKGIGNPILMLGLVQLMVLVGFVQLIMVFLRQSAIPIICLLMPVAGGGRTGGDVTRQWAPRLITSGLVIVAYKPILAVIVCTGFSEFGHSGTLAEWLRGCATLILGVLAPGPLTKVFAPFGAAVGGGLASGGMGGAIGAATGFLSGNFGGGGDGPPPGGGPPSGGPPGGDGPVERAQYVENSMGKQGDDARAQAARNEAPKVPAQAGPQGAPTGGQTATTTGTATSTSTTASTVGSVGTVVTVPIQVLDGLSNTVQNASGEVGGGPQQ